MVVQGGEAASAYRPKPERLVTANEGILKRRE
jgi:hypothetical protein